MPDWRKYVEQAWKKSTHTLTSVISIANFLPNQSQINPPVAAPNPPPKYSSETIQSSSEGVSWKYEERRGSDPLITPISYPYKIPPTEAVTIA
jgi:hypothetical protein